ncbi:hypothetical protein Daesc_010221 [Daldinia eschscholtzii]|uniref:NADP-dependent oxidoreductase domain-containing protein n=1 Tax=Daldinia eschscholtzii TaxID=292717 RepID=A0AAX6M730_9PEZI
MSPIPCRQLGKDGPLVPRIGFGAMGLSLGYGKPMPDEQRLELLDHAHSIGETFWDTSDFYGDSEDLIGKWFAKTGKRSDIFLATKFGGIRLGEAGFGFRGDAEYVHEACEKSLKRLGVDYIDLWYPHRLDGSTPVEHIVAEMVKMKDAVQVEYSPFTTDIEDPQTNLLATCRELGVAVVAYSPLSRGLLSGRIKSPSDFEPDDVRRRYPRFSPENFPKNIALVEALRAVAAEKGSTTTTTTAAQLALAWLLSQGDDIFPIPGTTRIASLEENCAAASISLSPEEVARIRSFVETASCRGARYPPEHALALFADTPLPEDYARGLGNQGKVSITGALHESSSTANHD